MTADLEVLPDPEALARRAAERIIAAAQVSSGHFSISLSGGSTPKRLYQMLVEARLPWDRIHWFWGDERFVPPTDPSNNARMVREALLNHVPVPADHIHPMPTTGMTADQAAAAYERTLKTYYGAPALGETPLFDIMLLGLGTNGHTASLFPDQKVLQERSRWVGTMHDAEAGTRLTLTYPALESARETLFLVAGADKKTVLREVMAGDPQHPASHVRPKGSLIFIADKAAAG